MRERRRDLRVISRGRAVGLVRAEDTQASWPRGRHACERSGLSMPLSV